MTAKAGRLKGPSVYPFLVRPGSSHTIRDNTNILYAGLVNETYGGIWETTDALDGANAVWFRLGDGTGASATATFSTTGGGTITGFVSASSSGGSGYADSATIPVYLIGSGNGATATATTNASGIVTGLTLTNAGTGYTSAPTVYITSSTDQPEKVDGNWTAMHINQLMVLPKGGNNLEMGLGLSSRIPPRAIPTRRVSLPPTAPSGGTELEHLDQHHPEFRGCQSAPGSSADLSDSTYSLTIDPNNTNDWYITTDGAGSDGAGYIYESTNSGANWFAYSSVVGSSGQGYSFWIQPGGTEALFGSKGSAGLEYTPNYKATNGSGTPDPQFYYVQGFPFQMATNVYQNPFDPNQIWVTSFGNGMWEAELSQISTASVPQNVTATAMSSSEAMVTWTPRRCAPQQLQQHSIFDHRHRGLEHGC